MRAIRRRCVPSAAGSGTRPRKQRGKGVQHLFARARRYRQILDSDQAKSLRDLGRQEGVSSARVSQILNVLNLAPEIIDQVDVPAEQLPPGINVTRLLETQVKGKSGRRGSPRSTSTA